MSADSFSFTFDQDEKLVLAALKTRAPGAGPKVKGAGWAAVIKVIQCLMLGFGALGLGIVIEYMLSGQIRLNPWAIFIGLVFLYIAVFGSIFVTLPVMARRALSSRVNEGRVIMTLDASGLSTRLNHFNSHIAWAGMQGVVRTKTAFVFFVGANRPSLPLVAVGDADQIDILDAAFKNWIGASR